MDDKLSKANTAINDKQTLIDSEAKTREENAYQKLKQERDAKFTELEGVKADEEAQVNDLQEQYNEWIRMRNQASNNATDDEFAEFHKRAGEVKKQIDAAQVRLEATVAKFEIEKDLKTTRDNDEAAKEANRIFEERSATRKTEFDAVKGPLDTAKAALKANLDAIDTLKAWLADSANANDSAKGSKETELSTAEGETQGLRDDVETKEGPVNEKLLAQAKDELYMERLKEYNAFEVYNKAKMQLDKANADKNEVLEELPSAQEELEEAQYNLDEAVNFGPDEYAFAKDVFDEVQARVAAIKNKQNDAQAVYDNLKDEVPTFLEDYESKKEAR